jgi:fanconi anemia group M protein
LTSLNKGWLIVQQKQFLAESSVHQHPQQSTIKEHFSTCVSLYHALECLERHGWRVFINYFDDESGEKYFVRKDRNIKEFLDRLREEFGPNPFTLNDSNVLNGSTVAPEIPADLDYGHPKYGILKRHLMQYFEVS